DHVQAVVDSFAKQNGFVANKNRKDLDPKAGTYQPKKVEDINLHCDSSLSKTNCKWKVGFYLGKYKKKKFRDVRIHDESDASTMLSYLLQQHDLDSDYIVIPWLEGPSNELTAMQYFIYHFFIPVGLIHFHLILGILLQSQGVESTMTKLLHYINQLRIGDVYTLTIRKHVNKKVQFGAMMSMVKTSIQVAVSEGVTEELTGVLVQFIMKYYRDTGLGIKEIFLPPSMFSTKVVEQETSPLNMASEVVELASNLLSALLTTTQIT
ncbi:1894_t:CDS:2, partial [Cetraspora pellucida]